MLILCAVDIPNLCCLSGSLNCIHGADLEKSASTMPHFPHCIMISGIHPWGQHWSCPSAGRGFQHRICTAILLQKIENGYIMLYYVILCYIMLYYVILCYIMLYYVILCDIFHIFSFLWRYYTNNFGDMAKLPIGYLYIISIKWCKGWEWKLQQDFADLLTVWYPQPAADQDKWLWHCGISIVKIAGTFW